MESISNCGGAVLDTQQYSNHLVRISLEIPSMRLQELVAGVAEAGVSLTQASVDEASAEAKEQAHKAPAVRMSGTLVIGFVSDEPDLRIPSPPVPG